MSLPHENAFLLLRKAKDDLRVMLRLIKDEDMPAYSIGFHAQQAIEKAIKAVIDFHGFEFPFTHDITRLVELLKKKELPLPPDVEILRNYTPFGATLRYEDEEFGGVVLDRAEAQKIVPQTVTWAESILTEKHT